MLEIKTQLSKQKDFRWVFIYLAGKMGVSKEEIKEMLNVSNFYIYETTKKIKEEIRNGEVLYKKVEECFIDGK